jgi:hypothetical protein
LNISSREESTCSAPFSTLALELNYRIMSRCSIETLMRFGFANHFLMGIVSSYLVGLNFSFGEKLAFIKNYPSFSKINLEKDG